MRLNPQQQKLGRALQNQNAPGALGRQSQQFLLGLIQGGAGAGTFLDQSSFSVFESYKMGGTMPVLGEDQAWNDLDSELQKEIESQLRYSDSDANQKSYGRGGSVSWHNPRMHVYRRTGDQTGEQRFQSAVAQGAKVFDERRRTPAPNTEYQKRTVAKGGRSILAR